MEVYRKTKCHIHTTECHLAIKRNEILIHVVNKLKNTMLSERSLSQKTTYYDFLFFLKVQGKSIDSFIYCLTMGNRK